MFFLKDKVRLWLCFRRKEAAKEPSLSSMTGTSSSSLLQPIEDQYPVQTSSPGTPPPPPFSLPSSLFPSAKINGIYLNHLDLLFPGKKSPKTNTFPDFPLIIVVPVIKVTEALLPCVSLFFDTPSLIYTRDTLKLQFQINIFPIWLSLSTWQIRGLFLCFDHLNHRTVWSHNSVHHLRSKTETQLIDVIHEQLQQYFLSCNDSFKRAKVVAAQNLIILGPVPRLHNELYYKLRTARNNPLFSSSFTLCLTLQFSNTNWEPYGSFH